MIFKFASRLVLMIFCNLPFITWQCADLIFIFQLCWVPDLWLLYWKIWLIRLPSEKIQEESKIINNNFSNTLLQPVACLKWLCLLCHFRKTSFSGLHSHAQGWSVKMKKEVLQYLMNQPLGHFKNQNHQTVHVLGSLATEDFFCVFKASSKHKGVWENLRQLCKCKK